MPTREQVAAGERIVEAARARLGDRMQITYVLPDYYEEFPKPCMHGWAQAFMTIAPTGAVLPCPAASSITTLRFENIRERSLRDIWERSDAFVAYRGTAWMPEPCSSCERREIDFGGCRCQAFALLGDAALTDPACALSPRHAVMAEARDEVRPDAFVPRRMPHSTPV
jgi:pyrroloquinoline quinone biosynthesis protein E